MVSYEKLNVFANNVYIHKEGYNYPDDLKSHPEAAIALGALTFIPNMMAAPLIGLQHASEIMSGSYSFQQFHQDVFEFYSNLGNIPDMLFSTTEQKISDISPSQQELPATEIISEAEIYGKAMADYYHLMGDCAQQVFTPHSSDFINV